MTNPNWLSEDEIIKIISEVPSDDESVVDDSDDDPDFQIEPESMNILGNGNGFENKTNSIDLNSQTEEGHVITVTETINPPTWNNNYVEQIITEFSDASGPSDCITELEHPTPVDIFKKIFPEELLNIIVFQTNLYATQEGKRFTPTTPSEINTFLGINLLMGIKRQPSYRDYWSSLPGLHDHYISTLMNVNRFGWLLSHMHLNDNSVHPKRGFPDYDKLYKLRPMIEMLSQTFLKCYRPSKYQAIDESMIKFKGRSSLKQYMRDKPIKRGYKVWMLCDGNGYNLKFEIYTGKIANLVQKDLGASVILRLSEELVGKYHHLYFDNYFNSYNVMVALQKKQIYACGTVQHNRKHLPSLQPDKNLKRGDFDWQVSDCGIVLLKWRDRRTVHLLSNFHSPNDVVSVSRREKDGTVTQVSCPQALKDYNMRMNNVDKFDQMKKSYGIDRRSKKWWHRIFFHLLDAAVVNSYLIWKDLDCYEGMTHKSFRINVITSLVSPAIVSPRPSIVRSPAPVIQVKRHKPHVATDVRLEASAHQPERSTARRCAKCSNKNKQVRTMWACSVCKVPLCLSKNKTCFQDFHK